MKKSTTLLPSLLLGLAIALSNSGYAEAKEMDSNSKHVTTHSSKSTAKHSPATKKVVVKNKKSVKVKSEKIATAPKDVKKSKTVAKSKKSKADSAWFWVLGETWPFTARCVKKLSTSGPPISIGCFLLWKNMNRRTHPR